MVFTSSLRGLCLYCSPVRSLHISAALVLLTSLFTLPGTTHGESGAEQTGVKGDFLPYGMYGTKQL